MLLALLLTYIPSYILIYVRTYLCIYLHTYLPLNYLHTHTRTILWYGHNPTPCFAYTCGTLLTRMICIYACTYMSVLYPSWVRLYSLILTTHNRNLYLCTSVTQYVHTPPPVPLVYFCIYLLVYSCVVAYRTYLLLCYHLYTFPYLTVYMLTYVPTYIPIYIYTCIPTYINAYLHA